MSTPFFNEAGVNGLTPLGVVNGGMGELLAAAGNTIRVHVGMIEPKTVESSPVGGAWTLSRSLGTDRRTVRWDAQLACADDADLNAVEAAIEEAVAIIVAVPNPYEARRIVEAARLIKPSIKVLVRAHNDEEMAYFAQQNVDLSVMGPREVGRRMVEFVREHLGKKQSV